MAMRRGTFRLLRGALGSVTMGFFLGAPLLAQHAGAARGMPSVHMGGAIHSSPSFSAPARSFAPPSGSFFQGQRHPSSPSGHWPTAGSGHYPYRNGHGVGYRGPYLYAGYPWLIPFGYGLPYAAPYGDDEDEGVGAQAPPQQADYGNPPPDEYGPEPPEVAENAPSSFRPVYQGQIEAAPVHVQPGTTLIFKDGRAPMQVHNYALTGSTLYALDGDSRQEIPLSLLDVPATMEANRKAGVDFALPVSR